MPTHKKTLSIISTLLMYTFTLINCAKKKDSNNNIPTLFASIVTKSNSGIEVIRKGTSSDGITAISDSNFQTVIDYTISSDFTSKVSVSSPSVISWPDSSWN